MAIKHKHQTILQNDPNKDISANAWNEEHDIGNGTIINVHISDVAAISESKLALNFPTHRHTERNILINGNFGIAQYRTTLISPNNNDNVYFIDNWRLLSDGNNIVNEYWTTEPDGKYVKKSVVVTANRKFGMFQIVENLHTKQYVGKYVSLSFRAYTISGKEIRNLRAAVLSWTGTANNGNVTFPDPISSWNNQGENPTLSANWNYENTPSNLALTTDTSTIYKIENISLDSPGITNLGVLIWVDDADCAVGDELYITDIMLNEGIQAADFAFHNVDQYEELKSCQRQFKVNASNISEYTHHRISFYYTNVLYVEFPFTMLKIPTLIGMFLFQRIDTTVESGFSFSCGFMGGNSIILSCTKTAHGLTDGFVNIYPGSGFDARL